MHFKKSLCCYTATTEANINTMCSCHNIHCDLLAKIFVHVSSYKYGKFQQHVNHLVISVRNDKYVTCCEATVDMLAKSTGLILLF